jgi:hypothetical protein
MEMTTSLAAQSYAQTRTAAAPTPQGGGDAGGGGSCPEAAASSNPARRRVVGRISTRVAKCYSMGGPSARQARGQDAKQRRMRVCQVPKVHAQRRLQIYFLHAQASEQNHLTPSPETVLEKVSP